MASNVSRYRVTTTVLVETVVDDEGTELPTPRFYDSVERVMGRVNYPTMASVLRLLHDSQGQMVRWGEKYSEMIGMGAEISAIKDAEMGGKELQ